MACLTSIIEPLRAANEITGSEAFSWELFSQAEEKVISSAGLVFECHGTLIEMEKKPDYLVLLSAPMFQFASEKIAGKIRYLARHGTILGAISGGVFPLVQSGVALPPKISVHWCYSSAFAAKFPQVDQGDDVLHITPTCVTASGAAAAFDLALHLIETSLGTSIAQEVACWFQHPMMRKSGVKQNVPIAYQEDSNHGSEFVNQAVEIFTRDLSSPKSIKEIAQTLCISPRHLERSFKSATGSNPSRYFRQLRLKSARQVILYTNDDIADVAANVGYLNPSDFSKHYRAEFGCSPNEDRQRINSFRVQGNSPLPSI